MPGKVIRVLDKNTYTYTSAQIPSAQSISFPVALNVDISGFPYQILLLRLHSATWAAGSTVNISAFNSSTSEDDPSLLFRTAAATCTATMTQGTDNAPALRVGAGVAGAAGGAFDIVVTITQATSATNLNFVISADLVLKS